MKPQGDNTGSFQAAYGERNLLEFKAMADVSIINDYLFIRVSGVSHQQDGYVTRVDYGCAFPASGVPAVGGLQTDCKAGTEGGKNYHAGAWRSVGCRPRTSRPTWLPTSRSIHPRRLP